MKSWKDIRNVFASIEEGLEGILKPAKKKGKKIKGKVGKKR